MNKNKQEIGFGFLDYLLPFLLGMNNISFLLSSVGEHFIYMFPNYDPQQCF